MAWLVYFGIIAIAMLIPFIVAGVTAKSEEFAFLDKKSTEAMKGVAILCVVVCHYMGTYGNGVTLFTPLGGIGVSVFLILSAYGLTKSWRCGGGYTAWWKKRLLAMIVPYGILEMIFYWPFHEFDIAAFCMDIMCIRPLYANGWYLSYMLLWYVLFYLIMRLRVLEKYRCQAFFAISLFLFFYFGNRSPIRAEQSLSFFAGFILAEYEDSEIIRNKITLKTGILMFALGIAFLAIKQLEIIRDAPAVVFNFVQLMIKLPCALGILIGVWMTSRKINLRFFQWVGMLSFDIYIIHGYLLEKTEVNYCGAIMFILLTTVCSVLFWLIMNKTRSLQKRIMRV